MKFNLLSRTLLLVSAVSLLPPLLCSCGDTPVFPISELPSEAKETFSPTLEVSNSTEQSRTAGEDTKTNPNSILSQSNFDVFFDNTTGCFMGYVKALESDRNDIGYQMFAKTMTSFKDIFDCSDVYRTYTLQPDENSVLMWKEYAENIFTNFGNISAYTANTHSVFADNQAPVTMWLEQVRERFENGDGSTIVYISDLNEQNGLLSRTGTEIKDILSSNPEKDLLVISYVLQYKGEISSPTFMNEGNNKSQVDTKFFEESVPRNYYALVFGDHETLSAFRTKTAEGFGDVDINMTSYMYRDLFYSEKETVTRTKSGEVIESSNIISDNPPIVKITDKDGETADTDGQNTESEAPQNSDDDLFGDSGTVKKSGGKSILPNLEICSDYSKFLTEKPEGQSFVLLNTIPDQGSADTQINLKLENADTYTLDTERAVVYTYKSDDGGFDESEGTGWVKADGLSDSIWSAELSEDGVSLKLSDFLSSDTVPVVLLSVPVVLPYTSETTSSEVINIGQDFKDWVESCKVPDIITEQNENERYTKTYGFDSFIDKITGYKSLGKEENKVSDLPEIQSESADVCRINLIILADEKDN